MPFRITDTMKTFMDLERIKARLIPDAELLSGHDKKESLLIIARENRDAGRGDKDEAFYIIYSIMEDLANERRETDAELAKISAAVQKKEKEYGLKKGEYWLKGDAPPDVEELEATWEERSSLIETAIMREYGENEMADLYMADRLAFFRRIERGREKIFGPLPEDLAGRFRELGIID